MHANRYKDIFTVDDTSDLPIWVQLRNRMTYLIKTGFFKEGEQLPSVRSLAAEAKINYNTVTKAYRELELANLIVNVRGRGMYVRKDLPQDGPSAQAAVDALLEDCIAQYRALGMTLEEIEDRFHDLTAALKDRIAVAAEERTGYSNAD